jgi:hypothetical protein
VGWASGATHASAYESVHPSSIWLG